MLLAAFEKLFAQNQDVELYIAGRGTDSAQFQTLYQHLSCKSSVFAMGEIDKTQVRDLLYDSDALVLATRGETQGLVLLEALSTGLPVISTEAIPESVRVDEASWFVAVDDVDALAEMMRRCSCQEMVYDGRKASRLVSEMASPRVIGQKIADVLSAACHV